MDIGALIGAGTSALGGILGGGKKTTETSSSQSLSPELQQFVNEIFAKIPSIFGREYPTYEGERVAGPTENRESMNPLIASMTAGMQQKASQPNPYQQRIGQVLDANPTQISVPDLLGRAGASGVTSTGGMASAAPLDSFASQQGPAWLSGRTS